MDSDPNSLLQQAMQHHHAGRLAQAEDLYRQILAIRAKDSNALQLLGLIHYQNGRHALAAELMGKAVAQNPDVAEWQVNLGTVHAALNNTETAEQHFRAAVRINPDMAEAHAGLGSVLLGLDKPADAAMHLNSALRINPNLAEAELNLGIALYQLFQFVEAEKHYRQALRLQPNYAQAHYNLGNLFSKNRQIDEAVVEYQQALRLRPNYGKAWVNLGIIFRALGQPETALKAYRLALQCVPPCTEAHFNYIKILSEDFIGNGLLLDWKNSVANAAAFNSEDDGKLISFVICSIDDNKFAMVSGNIARHFAEVPYEIIPIHDAVSLCEGYNRGWRLSRGDYLVFCHDDVEIIAPDFAPRLKQYLQEYDMVGVAGATLLCGTAWSDAGFPHLHGMVAHPGEDHGYELMVYGSTARCCGAIQAFDGLFFAVRREVMEKIDFDETLFDGFHLYDLDFSYRVFLAGFKMAVCNDLLLVHHSRGAFEKEWEHYAAIFLKKHSATLPNKPMARAINPAVELPTTLKLWEFAAALMENRDESMAPYSPEEADAISREIVQTPIHSYSHWLKMYAPEDREALNALRDKGRELSWKPLISLIMPTYNSPEPWLRAAIDSVLEQTYANWELCIADDASSQPHVRTILDEYRERDNRIKVVFRATNGHISAASNSALELADGEFIALLDHDDRLSPSALYHVAQTLNRRPDAILLYSDEDKINEDNQRYDPYFKCEWNPDLFYSHNLVTHLGVYRSETVRSLGGFRIGYEGAQDYDLALRVTEEAGASRIVHIPRVLYSWRTVAGSTSRGSGEKSYAIVAAVRAINDALQRRNINASAEESPILPGNVRVRHRLPPVPPMVSLIIPTRNGYEFLSRCVNSILSLTDYPRYEIIIVDNGSDEPRTLDYLREQSHHSSVRILRDERPFNYAALNNAAVKAASGSLLGFVNNDIEVIDAGWLKELVSHAVRPDIGAVGARLLFPNDTVQHAGVIIGIGQTAGHIHKGLAKDNPGYVGRAMHIQNFSAVTAACMLIRREVFEQAGGFDEINLPVAFNDIDLCLSIQKLGYRNLYTPFAVLYHYESATRGYETTREKKARFQRETAYLKTKWKTKTYSDPAYSPNLSRDSENPYYAFPPRLEADQ